MSINPLLLLTLQFCKTEVTLVLQNMKADGSCYAMHTRGAALVLKIVEIALEAGEYVITNFVSSSAGRKIFGRGKKE